MFCPLGYQSVAELWDIFRKKRLAMTYMSATRHYHAVEFDAGSVRGSPLDICEHTFLKSLSMMGLFLASPQGQVIKLHAPMSEGEKSLFSVLHYSASSYNAAAASIETGSKELVKQVAGPFYQSWEEEIIRPTWWRERYPLIDALSKANFEEQLPIMFHCLPFCFERWGYTVVRKLPPWAGIYGAANKIEKIVENFGGWAICLSDPAVKEWQPFLDGKPAYPDAQSAVSLGDKSGRPSKLGAAYSFFERMGFDKGTLSWAQLRAKISRETGDSPSDKTLRNWRDAHMNEMKS